MRFRTLGVFAVALLVLSAPTAMAATAYYVDVLGGPWTSNTSLRLGSTFGAAAPAGTCPGSATKEFRQFNVIRELESATSTTAASPSASSMVRVV